MNSRFTEAVAALSVLLLFCCLGFASFGWRRNEQPSVTCAAAQTSILQGETTTIRASAIKPRMSYVWKASGGKISGPPGNTVTFDATGLAPGKYTITVTAIDRKNAFSCSSDVTVRKRNHPPTVTCEPAVTVTEGESVTLNAVGSDPDSDPLTYIWEIDGERLAAAGPQIMFGSEGRKPGTYNVRISVSDGDASGTCSTQVAVKDRGKPTIECLTSTMDVASGGSIELRARATDPSEAKLTYTWASNGGTVTGRGETATFNASGVGAGAYTVTAAANNGREGKASCRMMVNVSELVRLTRYDCGYFDSGSARLDGCVRILLDSLAIRMKSDMKLRANIIGYTDSSWLERSDRDLGESRAKAVADHLEKQGVDASHLTVTNGGTNNPVTPKTMAAGQKLNRRVEIELSVR